MNRMSLLVASGVLASVVVSSAQVVQHQGTDKSRRLLEQLRSPIPVDFDAAPLGKLEAYFSNVVGLSIQFDWASLEPFGIDRESPVRLTAPNLPASTAMQLALYAAIAGTGEPPPELSQLRFVPAPTAEGLKVSLSRAGDSPE